SLLQQEAARDGNAIGGWQVSHGNREQPYRTFRGSPSIGQRATRFLPAAVEVQEADLRGAEPGVLRGRQHVHEVERPLSGGEAPPGVGRKLRPPPLHRLLGRTGKAVRL